MTVEQFAMLQRIEAKLDKLLVALAEEDEEQPARSFDGDELPGDRDQGQPL